MFTNINSFSFHEDFLMWTVLSKENHIIKIKGAGNKILPVVIDHDTIHRKDTIEQIANHLSSIIEENKLKPETVRVTIPARFAIIKNVTVDESIPEENYQEIVQYEFEKSWKESTSNYNIYLPEYSRTEGPPKELITVAIR